MDKQHISEREISQQTFTELFYSYKDKVYTIALRLTGSKLIAEEVVQEVFMRLWAKKEELLNIEVFEDYLFVMTRNYVYTSLKKIQTRNRVEENWRSYFPESEENTEETILSREYEQILQKAINTLSPQQKKVFILSREKELSRDEIAKILEVSPETVKTHLKRAVNHIRLYCSAQLDQKLPFGLTVLIALM